MNWGSGALSLYSTATQNHSHWVLALAWIPNATQNIPTCWYILALPNTKICVTPDANPRRQSVEYRWHWVPNAKFSHWACTFHIVYVNFICVGHPTQTCFSVEYGLKDPPPLDLPVDLGKKQSFYLCLKSLLGALDGRLPMSPVDFKKW